MQAVHQAIANFGSQGVMAEALGVSQPAVSDWAREERPVPAKRCVQIEQHPMNRDATRPVMRWDLRPSDWWEHWPELIGTKGAPKVKLAKAA